MAEINNTKLNISLDFRLISIILAAVILVMLGLWRPWSAGTSSDRTIKVTGETTVKAEPDEFVFYPSYQFKNANKEAGLAELTKKSDEVVSKLKELGIADTKIKSNSGGYETSYFRGDDNTHTYTLQLTVTTTDKAQAQKVQDYLLTTSPTGSVSPQAGFSQTMRKSLESKARDQATQDARDKAEQSAENLGFKIAKVKSVEDGAGFGGVIPLRGEAAIANDSAASTKLAIQPGENEISYTVIVTYFVK